MNVPGQGSKITVTIRHQIKFLDREFKELSPAEYRSFRIKL